MVTTLAVSRDRGLDEDGKNEEGSVLPWVRRSFWRPYCILFSCLFLFAVRAVFEPCCSLRCCVLYTHFWHVGARCYIPSLAYSAM